MDGTEKSSKKTLLTALALLIVVCVIVGASTIAKKSDNDNDDVKSVSTSSNLQPESSTQASTVNPATLKDGNYTATGTYNTPGGNQDITISVTLTAGKIADTSAVAGADDSTAKDYQKQFIEAYKEMVIGKDVSSASLDRVSGSSLTSQGFNDALKEITKQAQS